MKTRILSFLALSLCLAGQTLFAQSSVPNIITYQGRVTVGGQPFTGTGQFKFALVNGGTNTSRQAYAGATYPSGTFFDVIIADGGAGYTTAPAVSYSSFPGGSGGTATATVAGGVVTSITVNNVGTGYFGFINLVIAPPPVSLGYSTYWSHDNTSAGGSQPTSAVALPVANGLFVVPLGDTNQANMAALPTNVMTNDNVRLRIWFNDGTNGFAQLTPDQPLTAVPYALMARSAAELGGTYTGAVTLINNGNSFFGNGGALTGVNASLLGGLAASNFLTASGTTNFWKIGGNANTTTNDFLGTTDYQPLELRVNGQRAMLLTTHNATAMGYLTTASGDYSTAMGFHTTANNNYSTAMGINTIASGVASTAMGAQAEATGDYSIAMGDYAKAVHKGSFVWADSQFGNFSSTGTNQVSFRCLGGVLFTSGSGAANQTVAWTPGSASWSFSSDRNLKDRITSVDQHSVLDKLAQLPIFEWSYKGYDQRHIGPMAQDFHKIFPLNENDKALQDADLHGVALAAIQGLNQKVEEQKAENAELKKSVTELKQLVQSLVEKK